ncbi:MAG: DUF937 domain-containing protein [Oscillospiraceae bacterium]|nr:DUF937 domain-containing protein [Oscillospiraceae bacterium]
MDLQKLASTLLSSDAISGLSQRAGASASDVKNVLGSVLPSLLGGADNQAKGEDTAESFAAALASHAKDGTADLTGFLSNVDLEDGGKILSHLLGGEKESTTEAAAQKAGISSAKTSTIMSAVAPLLLSLLGQQADEDDNKDSGVAGLMGALLGNVDLGSLLGGLLGGEEEPAPVEEPKEESSGGLGGLLSGLLGNLLK